MMELKSREGSKASPTEKFLVKTVEEPVHKCSFCYKISRKAKPLSNCGHFIHNGCLKMKTISTLITGKYKMNCHYKDCNSVIQRSDLTAILEDKAKICYDTLNFLYDYLQCE